MQRHGATGDDVVADVTEHVICPRCDRERPAHVMVRDHLDRAVCRACFAIEERVTKARRSTSRRADVMMRVEGVAYSIREIRRRVGEPRIATRKLRDLSRQQPLTWALISERLDRLI